MVSSRRQRNKAEGTFLEAVKEQLNQILFEVDGVKKSIEELKSSQSFQFNYDEPVWDANHGCVDSWWMWQALGFEGASISNQLRADAPSFHSRRSPDADGAMGSMIIPRSVFLSIYGHMQRESKLEDTGTGWIMLKSMVDPHQAFESSDADSDCCIRPPTLDGNHGGRAYRHWLPGSKDFIRPDSATADEWRSEAAQIIQRCFRRRKIEANACRKCSLAECVCAEVVCHGCMKSGDRCNCALPLLQRWQCSTCGLCFGLSGGAVEDQIDLASGEDRRCTNCSGALSQPEWNWLYPSDHVCGACWTYTDQKSVQWCSATGCEASEMFHEACMFKINQQFVCRDCLNFGRQPRADNDDSGSSCSEAPPVEISDTVEKAMSNTGGQEDSEASRNEAASSNDIQEPSMETLGVTLDYIVRFLEGEHARSLEVTADQRSKILQEVKSTLKWKMHPRTTADIRQRQFDLNAMMCDILKMSR